MSDCSSVWLPCPPRRQQRKIWLPSLVWPPQKTVSRGSTPFSRKNTAMSSFQTDPGG